MAGKETPAGPNATQLGWFFALSLDMLGIIGLDGYFRELNPAWERVLGFSQAELKERPVIEFVHPDDRGKTRLAVQNAVASAEATAYTNRVLCQDGSYKWLAWRTQLAPDEGIIYALVRDITERRQREDSLHQALAQQRELLARLLSVREDERTRLARKVHDELGQALTGLKMDLAWLQGRLGQDQAPLLAKTQAMSQLIDTTVQAVRQIAIELRPAILDDLGLVAAIEWQLQDLQKRTGLECTLITSLEEIALDVDGRTTIFRILQEILTNVSRHAQATQVKVLLEETAQHLVLQVHDNGRGISQDAITSPHSIGLLGMRERARLRKGEVHVQGSTGKGTAVTVRLPLEKGQTRCTAQALPGEEGHDQSAHRR